MAEDVFWNRLAPAESVLGGKGRAHLSEIEIAVVVGEVAIGHVGIEEFEGLTLAVAEGVHAGEESLGPPLGQLLAVEEVGMHLGSVLFVGDEMGVATASGHDKHSGQGDNGFEKGLHIQFLVNRYELIYRG